MPQLMSLVGSLNASHFSFFCGVHFILARLQVSELTSIKERAVFKQEEKETNTLDG